MCTIICVCVCVCVCLSWVVGNQLRLSVRDCQCYYWSGLCWICWALLHQHVHLHFPNYEAQSAWKWSCTHTAAQLVSHKNWRTYDLCSISMNVIIACCLREYKEQPCVRHPCGFVKACSKWDTEAYVFMGLLVKSCEIKMRQGYPAHLASKNQVPHNAGATLSRTIFAGWIAAFATFQKKSSHPLWFGLCLTSRVLWWQQQKRARLKIYSHRNPRSFWTPFPEIPEISWYGKIEVTSHWRVWAQLCANLCIFFCRFVCAQSFVYVYVCMYVCMYVCVCVCGWGCGVGWGWVGVGWGCGWVCVCVFLLHNLFCVCIGQRAASQITQWSGYHL